MALKIISDFGHLSQCLFGSSKWRFRLCEPVFLNDHVHILHLCHRTKPVAEGFVASAAWLFRLGLCGDGFVMAQLLLDRKGIAVINSEAYKEVSLRFLEESAPKEDWLSVEWVNKQFRSKHHYGSI